MWLNDLEFDIETGGRIYGNWLNDPHRVGQLMNITIGGEGLRIG